MMTADVVIRPVTPADAEALSELICSVLYASNLGDYGLDNIQRVASHFVPDNVREMNADGRIAFLAEMDEKVVGTASIHVPTDEPLGSVRTFFVAADMQRCGIGARLYAQLLQSAASKGVTKMRVRSSIAGVPFYERLGFFAVEDHWDGSERTVEMRN